MLLINALGSRLIECITKQMNANPPNPCCWLPPFYMAACSYKEYYTIICEKATPRTYIYFHSKHSNIIYLGCTRLSGSSLTVSILLFRIINYATFFIPNAINHTLKRESQATKTATDTSPIYAPDCIRVVCVLFGGGGLYVWFTTVSGTYATHNSQTLQTIRYGQLKMQVIWWGVAVLSCCGWANVGVVRSMPSCYINAISLYYAHESNLNAFALYARAKKSTRLE